MLTFVVLLCRCDVRRAEHCHHSVRLPQQFWRYLQPGHDTKRKTNVAACSMNDHTHSLAAGTSAHRLRRCVPGCIKLHVQTQRFDCERVLPVVTKRTAVNDSVRSAGAGNACRKTAEA